MGALVKSDWDTGRGRVWSTGSVLERAAGSLYSGALGNGSRLSFFFFALAILSMSRRIVGWLLWLNCPSLCVFNVLCEAYV